MGHHSKNLLYVPELSIYSGAILSPVNYCEDEVISQVTALRKRKDFEIVFDPQLYYPRSKRGKLPTWSYFPSDVDTSDIQSEAWWCNVADNLSEVCSNIKPTSVCSPAFTPNRFTNNYYSLLVQLGNYFIDSLQGTNICPIQTVIVGLADLATMLFQISSIVSRTKASSIYLVFISNINPRRELNKVEELKGAMKLIKLLEDCGLTVIVGFSSSDLILWKTAGASICATGKYFNLRRFTSSRFDEPEEGGGQLPYWFEESLLAFLRESDIIRARNSNVLSKASLRNPFCNNILLSIEQGTPWLGLSWRQYLYAFGDLEYKIDKSIIDVQRLVIDAEQTWLKLEDENILMEEMRNNGEWVRTWRRALTEFNS